MSRSLNGAWDVTLENIEGHFCSLNELKLLQRTSKENGTQHGNHRFGREESQVSSVLPAQNGYLGRFLITLDPQGSGSGGELDINHF
jgi:hypothetical protein